MFNKYIRIPIPISKTVVPASTHYAQPGICGGVSYNLLLFSFFFSPPSAVSVSFYPLVEEYVYGRLVTSWEGSINNEKIKYGKKSIFRGWHGPI